MAANFDLSNFALQSVCPGNELLYDDLGMPSVMVRIPKLTYAQLGMGSSTAVHPAFIVNGMEVEEIYISKYLNVIQNSRAYSLPGADPKTTVNFDTALQACAAKGNGWHLMTRMEWGLLIRWCQNNGVMPKGNNDYGKHSTETGYKAIPAAKDETHYATRTLTGTGPVTWYHSQEANGIADLCGNVGELCGGVRIVHGELQLLANNNGADSTRSQGASSTEWKAVQASDGVFITPDGSGTTSGSVKLDWQSGALMYNTTKTGNTGSGSTNFSSCTFANISCHSSLGAEAKLLLQNLGMLIYGSGTELFSANLNYIDNVSEERVIHSGGYWSNTAFGMATFYGAGSRITANANIGFRAAFVKLPTD